MSTQYFYADASNQPVGPFSLPNLKRLLDAGIITSTTLICAEGGLSWSPLDQVISPLVTLPQSAPTEAPVDPLGKTAQVPLMAQPTQTNQVVETCPNGLQTTTEKNYYNSDQKSEIMEGVAPSKVDAQRMWGLRIAMFAMPFYMLSSLFILIQLWDAGEVSSNLLSGRIALAILIVMVGISLRSWQCIGWLNSAPFKAAAIGKNLFLIFLVLTAFEMLLSEFPRQKFEGPAAALHTEEVVYGFQKKTLSVIDPDQITFYEPNFLWWMSFLFKFGNQLTEHIAIFAFVSVLYQRLRQGRPDFTFLHFLNEVSFGQFGREYLYWSEARLSHEILQTPLHGIKLETLRRIVEQPTVAKDHTPIVAGSVKGTLNGASLSSLVLTKAGFLIERAPTSGRAGELLVISNAEVQRVQVVLRRRRMIYINHKHMCSQIDIFLHDGTTINLATAEHGLAGAVLKRAPACLNVSQRKGNLFGKD